MAKFNQARLMFSQLCHASLISLSALCIIAPLAHATTETTGDRMVSAAEVDRQSVPLIAQEMGCPRALGIVYYATDTYHISICEGQDGYLFYRGVEFSDPSNAINVPEVYVDGEDAYTAVNGNVSYSINPYELTVYQDGNLIWQEPVISWSYGD